MIKAENLTINGKAFIRTYSDSGYMVERDGVRYSEAIDPVEFNRTYTENHETADTELTAEEALSILLGGAEDA